MTKRFVLVLLIAFTAPMVLPNVASAQTQNKFVFEIKNLKLSTADISDALNSVNNESKLQTETIVQAPAPIAGPAAPVVNSVAKKISYTLPPKITGDARVYMQEPEIRAYVCPKLGDKCNIFIAILKGENGTHECTRDNRGLNLNGSVDIGLAQINWKPGSPHSFENLQNCKYNLDVALSMYARRGFQPWYVYTQGSYKRHLAAVLANAKAVIAEAPAVQPENTPVNTAPEVAIATPTPLPISN